MVNHFKPLKAVDCVFEFLLLLLQVSQMQVVEGDEQSRLVVYGDEWI